MTAQHPEIRPEQSLELLKQLHILTRDGKLNQDSRRKLKQVYHLYQFIEPLLAEALAERPDVQLVDHGAGKSYLGFILYDLFFKSKTVGRVIGVETRAELVGNEYVINGSKAFISGAGSTDVLVLMARTGDAQSGASGISAFAVPADTPGISYGKKEQKMGWNSQPTRTISFDNVRIPADHLLGREGEGFKIAMKGLDGGRINIATCSVGAAQGALNAAQQYMQDRKQFGKPIASFQALQFKLADMATELVAARQMVRLAASKLDAGARDASTYCAMAKRFATDAGFTVINDALQLHGRYGYIREYPLERLLRDARVHQILEGTNEIMRVIIARRMLDGDATDVIR